ncbi:MAG: glycosyltransferase family 32 protein [Faecousia sp.]
MIPKKIHYCWFGGGEKPKLAQKCIASWKKYCSDYEIIEWNEDNFDVNMNGYTRMCYENKKWAFLSDYVRLLVVYQHGGLYFDTDVELLRNPDFLLGNKAFFGFETETSNSKNASSNSGLAFGSVASGLALEMMLKEYEPLLDGKHGVRMCPELNSRALEKLGLVRDGSYQKFEWGTVYPKEYFNPYESTTGVLEKTENTVSIHWYMGSCLTTGQKIRCAITKPLHRAFGKDIFGKIGIKK